MTNKSRLLLHHAVRHTLAVGLTAAAALNVAADSPDKGYDDFRKSLHDDYDSFLNDARRDYADFRQAANRDYAKFLADSNWVPAKPEDAVPRKKLRDNSLPPQRTPQPVPLPPIPPTPLTIEDIVVPQPLPQPPRPLSPIEYDGPAGRLRQLQLTLWGTGFDIDIPRHTTLRLGAVNPREISRAWERLSADHALDATLGDLLRLRDSRHLCDWAYYLLIKALSNQLYGEASAASAIFTAYAMNQSGYATRLAYDSASGRVYAMPGTENLIFDQPYFPVGDVKFYPMARLGSVQIISADYPGSRPLSMLVGDLPLLAEASSPTRSLQALHVPELKVSYTTNPNLMEFFAGYPASSMPGNTRTKWAYYALTPMSQPLRESIYPTLRSMLAGKSQHAAADLLMDFCESIPYAADNEVWGYDRAYFADETLHYQTGDCEDHAILFVRLVRDLMGLDTALIYFPNHLAAAVCFTEEVPGHYIEYDGRRFTVCDPTIFYSGVGHLMDGCDPSRACLIPLSGLR